MKIALFCPNWVGDLVMATPALRAVRNRFADADIVGILRPHLADVLQGAELIDRTLFHDPRGNNPAHRSWALCRQLRYERFDLAILLTNSFRTALLAWAGGAKRRLGFSRDARGWLLTDALPAKSRQKPHPVIDEYLRLAHSLGGDVPQTPAAREDARRMELATTPKDQQQYARFLKRISDPEKTTGIVCLNPGGAFGAAKHWPSSSFAELGRLIAENYRKQVVVLCGPAERGLAREIVHEANHPQVVSLAAENLSLGLTKEAVRRADLLVTTDSGPRHFAAPFGVPVVTLFGPTHIAWSETYYSQAVHLQLAVDCGPCQQRTCPLGHHRCMRELRVDRVLQAAGKFLGQDPRRAVA